MIFLFCLYFLSHVPHHEIPHMPSITSDSVVQSHDTVEYHRTLQNILECQPDWLQHTHVSTTLHVAPLMLHMPHSFLHGPCAGQHAIMIPYATIMLSLCFSLCLFCSRYILLYIVVSTSESTISSLLHYLLPLLPLSILFCLKSRRLCVTSAYLSPSSAIPQQCHSASLYPHLTFHLPFLVHLDHSHPHPQAPSHSPLAHHISHTPPPHSPCLLSSYGSV